MSRRSRSRRKQERNHQAGGSRLPASRAGNEVSTTPDDRTSESEMVAPPAVVADATTTPEIHPPAGPEPETPTASVVSFSESIDALEDPFFLSPDDVTVPPAAIDTESPS